MHLLLIQAWACLFTFISGLALYGQPMAGNTKIAALPPPINSGFEESKPIASRNGDTLYFVRSFYPENIGGEEAGSDIWVSYRKQDGHWSIPSNELETLNTPDHDQVIGLSDDGSTLYTIKYILIGNKRYIKILQSKRQATHWSVPSPVGVEPILIPDGYHEFYMHSSGNILLISMKSLDSLGEEDLYLSEFVKGEGWSKPVNLGVNVNSPGFEISPFLSHDMTRLYFASNGLGGLGDSDLWYSTRIGESLYEWSEPRHLEDNLNSNRFDAFYFQTQSGVIYFTSNRNGTHSNIYTLVSSKSIVSPAVNASVEKVSPVDKIDSQKTQQLVIYFDLDREELSHAELKRLEHFCQTLLESTVHNIQITGYTDQSGPTNYNMDLSNRRASNTKEILKKMLTEDFSIQTNGKGVYHRDENPSEMRRVEIMVHFTR